MRIFDEWAAVHYQINVIKHPTKDSYYLAISLENKVPILTALLSEEELQSQLDEIQKVIQNKTTYVNVIPSGDK